MREERRTPPPEKTGERLDRYLSEELQVPRSQVQDWLEKGLVTAGGAVRPKNYRLRARDEVAGSILRRGIIPAPWSTRCLPTAGTAFPGSTA